MKIKETYNPEDIYDLLIAFTIAFLALILVGRLVGVC